MDIQRIEALLSASHYPGRGIIMGRSADDFAAVIAYFIMGRSENSRNRIFVPTPDGIRTQARDPEKMTDPRLIIYHPIREIDGKTIVTNGDQTDTIRNALAEGHCYRHALLQRAFEPDGPNWTPRISAVLKPDFTYNISILKSLYGDASCCCRYFFEYDAARPGLGHLIHTYQSDRDPLPSFEGEPRPILLDAPDAASLSARIWSALDAENKVALFVRYIDRATGEKTDIIQNRD